MKVVHSDAHRRHEPAHEVQAGEVIGLYEVPARAEAIRAVLAADATFHLVDPETHGRAPIDAVHDPDLVRYLEHAWTDWVADGGPTTAIPDTFRHPGLRAGMGAGRPPVTGLGRLGYWSFDTATPMVEGTYGAARAAVDVALTATDLVLGGEPAAYALCRPPGHHAPRGAFGGYCFFNNVAVAAQHARHAGAARVAVLDVDYHHGNGTQQIFYERPDVAFVSLHADPDRAYPYVTGFADETGTGAGRGTTRNLLLPAGCDDVTYLGLLDAALEHVDRSAPDLVLVSLGVDTYGDDPIGDLSLTGAVYGPAGAAIGSLGRPTVVVQEGGYHLPTVGANVRSFLRGLMATPIRPAPPSAPG